MIGRIEFLAVEHRQTGEVAELAKHAALVAVRVAADGARNGFEIPRLCGKRRAHQFGALVRWSCRGSRATPAMLRAHPWPRVRDQGAPSAGSVAQSRARRDRESPRARRRASTARGRARARARCVKGAAGSPRAAAFPSERGDRRLLAVNGQRRAVDAVAFLPDAGDIEGCFRPSTANLAATRVCRW